MSTSSANQRAIQSFLQQSLQFATKIEVVIEHLDVSGRGSSIQRLQWDGVDPAIEEFSTKLWEAADHHASVMGVVQKYRLKAFDLDDKGQRSDIPINTGAIKVEPTLLGGGGGDEAFSEPPTSQGVLAMFMRHNQEMMRLTIASTGALTSHLARTVENLSGQNERLMSEKVNSIVVMEDLMSRKEERDLERRRTEAEIERKKEMWGQLAQLGPIVVNKLAGQELIRQKASPLEATIMAFAETLTPDKLDQIMKSGIFGERQMVLLGTVLEQVMKTMVTAKEKGENLATAHKATVGDLGDIGVAAASAMFGGK